MGVAVTFVMALATLVTYPIYQYIMIPLGIDFLEIIVFIFIIASLVQMLEKIIQKISPSLYQAMESIFRWITTNCAVLGVTELLIGDMSGVIGEGVAMNLGWAVLYAFFAGLGFTLVMMIMSGMRERLNATKIGKHLSGFPISMITASFICIAFTVFGYIV